MGEDRPYGTGHYLVGLYISLRNFPLLSYSLAGEFVELRKGYSIFEKIMQRGIKKKKKDEIHDFPSETISKQQETEDQGRGINYTQI